MSPFILARTRGAVRIAIISGLAAAMPGLGILAPAGSSAAAHQTASSQAAPTLHVGSRGPAVRSLQAALARLTYLPGSGVDGLFGMQTWHAVVAFQGWNYLTRDGIAGVQTQSALARAQRPAPWSKTTGFEIHIAQQVLLVVDRGRVVRAIHVSTGARGATPPGHFRIYRRDPMSWSVSFRVWMPLAQYFYGGFAMHQFASVPAYPASHGCVRIPEAEARFVWQLGRIGMRVWTRP